MVFYFCAAHLLHSSVPYSMRTSLDILYCLQRRDHDRLSTVFRQTALSAAWAGMMKYMQPNSNPTQLPTEFPSAHAAKEVSLPATEEDAAVAGPSRALQEHASKGVKKKKSKHLSNKKKSMKKNKSKGYPPPKVPKPRGYFDMSD